MRIERSGDSRRTANGNPRAAGIYPPSPAQTAERIKPLHQLGRVGEVPSAPVRRMPLTMVVAGMIGAVAIVGGGVVIVLASARQDVPCPDPSPSGSLGVTSSPTSSSPIPMTATSASRSGSIVTPAAP